MSDFTLDSSLPKNPTPEAKAVSLGETPEKVEEKKQPDPKTTAKQRIEKLLFNYFQLEADNYLSKYNESQTKSDFIEPLFEALGWDVTNRDHARIHEVTREENISKGRVDYGFRIDGVIKFYLEAKSFKEGVDDESFVEQAINYAWNKDCTWAILTNFKTLKIFNAQWHTKDLSQNHLKTINCSEFLERFEELWYLSSEFWKRSTRQGSSKMGQSDILKSGGKPASRRLYSFSRNSLKECKSTQSGSLHNSRRSR